MQSRWNPDYGIVVIAPMFGLFVSRFVIVALLAAAIGGCAIAASPESPAESSVPAPATQVPATATQVPATATPIAAAPVTTPDEAVARVVAAEPRFAAIGRFDPELIGQPSWYTVEPAADPGAFVVTFRIGSGDCPSGCIDEHRWVYHVAPDGAVTLASGTGDPDPSLPAGRR